MFLDFFCINVDILSIHDTFYMSITIVRIRSGQEEYAYTIHS
jgi:hypothetical protein